MDSKVTWKVEVLSAVDSKSKSMDVNAHITKVTWRIQNFSSFKDREGLYSENFTVDGTKWRIIIIPSQYKSSLSIYLEVADSENLPYRSSSYSQFGLAVIDQIDRKSSITKVSTMDPPVRFPVIFLSEICDPKRGYLIKDACLIEVYVSTDRTEGLISRDFMLQTDVPSEEDMNKFFTSLESQLLSSSNVFSQEDAMEALAKVDEALNMTPIHFYNSGKFYTLKHAFNILARFNGASIPIETEQKNELLVMEERLKELADRAAKAAQDKHGLTENQSMKLLKYKEFNSQVKQIEQKLVALLAERKEIFKSSNEIKIELEEFDAKAKVVEEEEKTIEAGWGRMKDFISSIKGNFC